MKILLSESYDHIRLSRDEALELQELGLTYHNKPVAEVFDSFYLYSPSSKDYSYGWYLRTYKDVEYPPIMFTKDAQFVMQIQDIPKTDPILLKYVESKSALWRLDRYVRIVEFPDGIEWELRAEENRNTGEWEEWVEEKHRTWR